MLVLFDIIVWSGFVLLVGWASLLAVICGLEFGGRGFSTRRS